MTRFMGYDDGEYENRNYAIYDLSKSKKTKEDFWDNEEECYDIWAFRHYLEENDCILSCDDVVELLNHLYQENQQLQRDMSIVHNKNKELMLENENLKHWNRCLAKKRHKESYLGQPKYYYCKADPIWVNDRGEITSKSREEFPKGETDDRPSSFQK